QGPTCSNWVWRNAFKTYTNQYTTNIAALNKLQRNEERDKKRHLSHKFSLTQASEFKWIGSLYGTRALLVSTLRQTVLQLENSLQASFMHPNWPLLRKPWITAVSSCVVPRDFARALIVLKACVKPVVFASVWHEALGHVRLQRLTAAEREDRKRLDKREKKEKEEEEERNRLTYNFVKYTLGLKHNVWKQKGEEYRVHGQWGWLWLSASRRYRLLDCRRCGLRAGPEKMMAQVKDNSGIKVIAVDPSTYKFLQKKSSDEDTEEKHKIIKEEVDELVTAVKSSAVSSEDTKDWIKQEKESLFNIADTTEVKNEVKTEPEILRTKVENQLAETDAVNKDVKPEDKTSLKHLKVFKPISEFEEIDITKALTSRGRLHYPKIAKKSKLDEFLTRRTHLKLLEERRLAQKAIQQSNKEPSSESGKGKNPDNETDVDIENEESDVEGESASSEQILPSLLLGRICSPVASTLAAGKDGPANSLARRVANIRQQYTKLTRFGAGLACYSRGCNMTGPQPPGVVANVTTSCYSPLCQQKARVRRDLLGLLKKANSTNSILPPGVTLISGGSGLAARTYGPAASHKSLVEDKPPPPPPSAEVSENLDAIRKDLETAVAVDTTTEDEAMVSIPVNKTGPNKATLGSGEMLSPGDTSPALPSSRGAGTLVEQDTAPAPLEVSELDIMSGPSVGNEVEVAISDPMVCGEVEISTSAPESCGEVEVSTSADEVKPTDEASTEDTAVAPDLDDSK
ncbi:unnamed protein product, partial [Timema podura]|nr:unnamed protein product [Timema podura]